MSKYELILINFLTFPKEVVYWKNFKAHAIYLNNFHDIFMFTLIERRGLVSRKYALFFVCV